MGKDSYLEGVLDAVSRLSDPDGLQHTSVSELSQNQAVIETQWKLGRNNEGSQCHEALMRKNCV